MVELVAQPAVQQDLTMLDSRTRFGVEYQNIFNRDQIRGPA